MLAFIFNYNNGRSVYTKVASRAQNICVGYGQVNGSFGNARNYQRKCLSFVGGIDQVNNCLFVRYDYLVLIRFRKINLDFLHIIHQVVAAGGGGIRIVRIEFPGVKHLAIRKSCDPYIEIIYQQGCAVIQ